MRKFLIVMMMVFVASSARADNLQIVQDLLHDQLLSQGAGIIDAEKLEVTIQKGADELQKSIFDTAEITNLEIEEDKSRFTAFVALNGLIPLEVNGKYLELVSVPALKHKMTSKQVITEDDIIYIDIDKRKLSRGFLVDENDIIGKSPARTIFANRAISTRYVKEQDLVHERKAVTLYFNSGLIQMQDLGVAMEDGAKGDFIRVRNSNSNVIVSGKVIGENTVEVAPQGTIIAQN